MQQDRNKSRRPSSSIQQNSAQRKGKPRKAYDWTQDRRPSNQDRRRTQGYQEQTLDFSGGNVTFENHSSGYADNSIQFPQQTARRPNNQNQSRRQGRQRSQRPRQNTTAYPTTNGSRPRNGQRPQNVQSARRPPSSGRYRPTEANLRSPARREGRKKRRLTRAAVRRRRAIRRLTALALLLCVIGVGVYLTVTMLFKINTLEVAVDGEVVQEVGGYSSAEILQALGVHAEENIFSFDPAEKAAALEKQFLLLENIRVERDYPNTVVVRTNAATAVYAMQTSGGWLSLSAGLKILDQDSAQPDLIILCGGEPVSTTPGTQLEFETGPSGPSSGSAASDSAASSEAGPPTDKRLESLNTLLTALDSSELGADVTRIEFEDPEQMAFLYQGRISVLLGTLNELDYKLRLAKYVLLNEDGKGCSPTDTGMLDLSHLSASSSRKFRFAQGEPTLPSGWTAPEEPAAPAEAEAESQPEEAPGTELDTEGAEAAPAEDPTAAAAEQQ